jgi:hypothetical protein
MTWFFGSSTIGKTCLSSLKYFKVVMPLWVMAYTTRFLPTILSSTRPCFIKNSRYSFRTQQLTLALYIMCVSLRLPFRAKTCRMPMYISSLDLRMSILVVQLGYYCCVCGFTHLHVCILKNWALPRSVMHN